MAHLSKFIVTTANRDSTATCRNLALDSTTSLLEYFGPHIYYLHGVYPGTNTFLSVIIIATRAQVLMLSAIITGCVLVSFNYNTRKETYWDVIAGSFPDLHLTSPRAHIGTCTRLTPDSIFRFARGHSGTQVSRGGTMAPVGFSSVLMTSILIGRCRIRSHSGKVSTNPESLNGQHDTFGDSMVESFDRHLVRPILCPDIR